jgi:uncharacterized glyoxalase superfamily protein PhnB
MSGAFPMISVDDLSSAVRFYEQLGFRETYRFPEDDPAFVTMERDGSTIGIGAGRADGVDPFAMWVYVDDVDQSFAALLEAGSTVIEPPEDRPWGERVACVLDPAAIRVYLGAPLT